jgi:hypothetical protein
MTQAGDDVVIAFDGLNQITIQNVFVSQLNAGDFHFV